MKDSHLTLYPPTVKKEAECSWDFRISMSVLILPLESCDPADPVMFRVLSGSFWDFLFTINILVCVGFKNWFIYLIVIII